MAITINITVVTIQSVSDTQRNERMMLDAIYKQRQHQE